ncbi:MAG TPA: D-alanyl-D-alanine carboxypeptidase family protein [Blastocatellia bacterium]|nr:D-alanyl-D-alanine carboxypeptidase family protein [Blastocatellia bacterium]
MRTTINFPSEPFEFYPELGYEFDPETGTEMESAPDPYCRSGVKTFTPVKPSDLITIKGYDGRNVRLHWSAGTALKKMIVAARGAGIRAPLLLPVSGYRSLSEQQATWDRNVKKYGGDEQKTRKFVCKPSMKCPHLSGLAVDLWMGSGVSSGNIDTQRRTNAYQWLVKNAPRFGFTGYCPEPWHWEYNPPAPTQAEWYSGLLDWWRGAPSTQPSTAPSYSPSYTPAPPVQPAPQPTPQPAFQPASELSGRIWVSRFPTSKSVNDLEPTFRNNVSRFLSALQAAGANIDIAATYRPVERAYLMHWSYKIAKGIVSARSVPSMPGVNIEWWHGSDADSKRAAQEMASAYQIVATPSLTSRHIERKAVDMSISWSGTLQIQKATGQIAVISSSPRDGTNRTLIDVGRSYGVIHLEPPEKDPPHWSTDGH